MTDDPEATTYMVRVQGHRLAFVEGDDIADAVRRWVASRDAQEAAEMARLAGVLAADIIWRAEIRECRPAIHLAVQPYPGGLDSMGRAADGPVWTETADGE